MNTAVLLLLNGVAALALHTPLAVGMACRL